jgi:hypothetical protein
MSEEQFWYGDTRLLNVYQKAYYLDKSYSAWLQGNYNMHAVERGARNALASKASDIDRNWVEYVDPLEKFNKPKITKDNLETEFRQSQANQNAWLRNILNGKK